MMKLAIIGMMAGSAMLGAQGQGNGVQPNGSSTTTQPAPQASCKNGAAQPAPQDSSKNTKMPMDGQTAQDIQAAKKRGIDTSVRSSYSNSNDKNASSNRSFESKCGTNSCDHDDGTVTPPVPQPGTGSAKAVKRSRVK